MTRTPLPRQRTKIVCTIGPACDSPEMLERMILTGMNVARLNFSHGEFAGHREIIGRLPRRGKLPELTGEMMSDLPAELRDELRTAALALDKAVIIDIVKRIRKRAPETARALGALAQDFRFGRIREILREEQ